jgi:hypothetical protein
MCEYFNATREASELWWEQVDLANLSTDFRPVPHSAVIGEIDTDKDATIDFSAIRAEPLPQIHF